MPKISDVPKTWMTNPTLTYSNKWKADIILMGNDHYTTLRK